MTPQHLLPGKATTTKMLWKPSLYCSYKHRWLASSLPLQTNTLHCAPPGCLTSWHTPRSPPAWHGTAFSHQGTFCFGRTERSQSAYLAQGHADCPPKSHCTHSPSSKWMEILGFWKQKVKLNPQVLSTLRTNLCDSTNDILKVHWLDPPPSLTHTHTQAFCHRVLKEFIWKEMQPQKS